MSTRRLMRRGRRVKSDLDPDRRQCHSRSGQTGVHVLSMMKLHARSEFPGRPVELSGRIPSILRERHVLNPLSVSTAD